MSFLLQKDTPLVVTIIIAAWTWIISQQLQMLDKLQIIEYAYKSDGHPNKITLRNISQSQSLKDIQVLVQCASRSDCFAPRGPYAGTTEFTAPFLVNPTEPGKGDANNAEFAFSLTTGAAITLVLYQSKPDDLQFSIANTENFDRLKIVESNSVQAWYYRNQWPIAIGALSLATVGVFGLLVAAGLRKQEDAIPAGHKRALNRPTGGSSRVSRKPGSGGKRYGRRRKSKP